MDIIRNSPQKTHIAKSKLEDIIKEKLSHLEHLRELEFEIIIKTENDRGENFDIKIIRPPFASDIGVHEATEIFFKIKGVYTLTE